MAQKTDLAAAKARKQKMILAAFGVGLVAIAAIQVPKLMKGSSQPATAVPAPAAAVAASTPAAAAVVVSQPTSSLKPAAYVAGVALPGGKTVVVAKSQLASFTLFEAKDPFVQQATDQVPTSTATSPAAPATQPAPATSSNTSASGASGTSAPPAPPVVYATVMFNGKPQQLKVKQKFPTGDPLFVLTSVKKNSAKIGVAGGAFDDGQNVTLTLGKKVTLVDTATGVRYELKLVYTGSAPEQIEGFSTTPAPSSQPAASSGGGSSTVSAAPTAAP